MFLAADRGTQAIYRATLSGKAAKVLDGECQIEAFSTAPGGYHAAFTAVWPDSPWELYAASLAGGRRETNLSHANDDAVAQLQLAGVKRLSYKARDGLPLEAFVMYPEGYQRGRRYPLAINVHGGPHSHHPGARSLVEYHSPRL